MADFCTPLYKAWNRAQKQADFDKMIAAQPPRPPPPEDPYAAEVRKEALRQYTSIRSHYEEKIETLYFAIGCKVFSEVAVGPLYNAYAQIVDDEANRDGIVDQSNAFVKAGRAGLARGAEPGACDYWHRHPEEVVELRRLVLSVSP